MMKKVIFIMVAIATILSPLASINLSELITVPITVETHLITSPSDYKKFGYNIVEEPFIYREQVLSDAHLPMAIKIEGEKNLVRGNITHLIAKQEGENRLVKIEYLMLVNKSYTVKVPVYTTRQKTVTYTDNKTGEQITKIINETYISEYKNEIRYKYVWMPLDKINLKLEPNKYYIFDIHGIIKPSIGKFSVDVIPEFNLDGNRIQLKQFAWWYSEWSYRKEMFIGNASNNYQMKITVYKNDGHDDPANATIDCEGHCRDDFGDIRFANETAELSYWIEEVNNSNYSVIWVKLPSDIENRTEKHIYMYYGNPSATTTSDGNNTFILFFDGTFDPTPQFTTVERTNGWLHQITISSESNLLFEGKFKLNSINARNWAGSQAIIFSNLNGTSIFDDDEINIRFYYNTDCSASETSPGVRLYAENENTASSSSRTRQLSEGNTYIYKLYLLSSTKARFEAYNMDGTLNFYKEVTTNVPDEDMTTFAFDNFDYHNDNGGGSSGDIFTYDDNNGCIIWKSQGSHYSPADSWIEHYIYWYRLRKYVELEPTWSNFESESIGLRPIVSDISPENGATGVPISNQGVNTSAYICQRYGKKMNITFYWNDSGTWKAYASWTNVGDGIYYAWNANFTALNTTYEWAINASNYGEPQNYTNHTYLFTTLDDILPAWFIANEDSTSITLEWGASPQADSYYIRYDTIPHSTWTPTTGTLLVNTTSTSYTHTGLTAGTTYYYALFIWNNTYGYSTEYKEDHTNTPYTSPNVVISNISPSDGAKHIDIIDNPPDPGGYVRITFQLNDTDGGGDMEYWLYIFNWSTNTWENRIHLTDQSNQTVTQDEVTFNTTGTYYYYRIATFEDGQWNNKTVKFRTVCRPKLTDPFPANNSIINPGYVTLKVRVSHPDYDYGERVYNVSFHIYPSGALIGYNYSATGFANNTIVECNNTDYIPPNTRYYWYAIAHSEDYENQSPVFTILTYYNGTEPNQQVNSLSAEIYRNLIYNGTEPNQQVNSLSAEIYRNPVYTNIEPNSVLYSMGGYIKVVYKPTIKYRFQKGFTVGKSTYIGGYLYKDGDIANWITTIYMKNQTRDFVPQIEKNLKLGRWANNLTINDVLSSGTFYHTTTNENGLILSKYIDSVDSTTYDYSTDPNMENPSKGRYIIHKNLSVTSNFTVIVNITKVAQSIGSQGSTLFFGLSNAEFSKLCLFAISDDTDYSGISNNVGVNAYVNGSWVASTWTELTDTNWHELKIDVNNNIVEFYVDGMNKGSISCDGDYLSSNIDRFVLIGDANSYDSYDIDEWDSVNQNMHFKHRRTDSGMYTDFRWDDLKITNYTYAYYTSGDRESPEYPLSGRAKSTKITWNSTEPSGTSVSVYYKLYNGVDWSDWQSATNGAPISGISDGDLIDGYKIKFKISLSTTDKFKTPILHNLTFMVDRYTKIYYTFTTEEPDTFYWYITTLNEHINVTNQTTIWSFSIDREPTELPSRLIYTVGVNATIISPIEFSDEYPPNGSINVPIDTKLCIKASKSDPSPVNVTFYFLENETGEWKLIEETGRQITVTDNPINMTYICSGLQYGTTYWWRAEAVNSTLGIRYLSPIYHFTTEPYADTEPQKVYYPLSAKIYILSHYETSPEETKYYFLGSQIKVSIPYATDPFPADNSIFGKHVLTNFSVYVDDPDTPTINVTFYYFPYYSHRSVPWYTVKNVPRGTRVYAPVPSPEPYLMEGKWLSWYVTLDDGINNVSSPIWKYKPENQPPRVIVKPKDGDTFVPVRRKLSTGEWKYFVRLTVDVYDVEESINPSLNTLSLAIYVDDPTLPNWNDWVLRLNRYDADNGIYMQDEEWFNDVGREYHWRVHVSDGYISKDYYMNFTTAFIFYSYFEYYPQHPTNEDIVHFIDESKNATRVVWYINGKKVKEQMFSSGLHQPANFTYKFNISNIYNITLWIYNSTANVTDMWYVNLSVDRNITFNKTGAGAGINYDCYHLNETTNASHFAKLLNLSNGWWIHKYDSQNETWHSYWVGMAGEDFNISTWDALAIVVDKNIKVRVNITTPVNTSQHLTIPRGYSYLVWSDATPTTSKNLSIGLQVGDWVFLYNTTSGSWYAYWIGYTGDDFPIQTYDVIVVNVQNPRQIKVG